VKTPRFLAGVRCSVNRLLCRMGMLMRKGTWNSQQFLFAPT
jgi:hypothetical protein